MNEEILNGEAYPEPFPHMIINNLYNEEELELIWEELKFFTKPGKLLDAEGYGGVIGYTPARAVVLDDVPTSKLTVVAVVAATLTALLYAGSLAVAPPNPLGLGYV